MSGKVKKSTVISKIVNFHPFDLKFEEDLCTLSLKSATNYILRSNLFYGLDFTCIVRCMSSSMFVCLWTKYLKKLWTDLDEICGRVWYVTRKNWFDFGEDPNPDPDPIIFLSKSSPFSDRAKTIYSTISQKVMDGFGQNLLDELVRWQEQADEILVQVRIQIRPISGIQNVN